MALDMDQAASGHKGRLPTWAGQRDFFSNSELPSGDSVTARVILLKEGLATPLERSAAVLSTL